MHCRCRLFIAALEMKIHRNRDIQPSGRLDGGLQRARKAVYTYEAVYMYV